MRGKFLLRLNKLHETDSSQVPRGNGEKHSDKRVKSVWDYIAFNRNEYASEHIMDVQQV